ncbi:MFS transporter [Macrococcus hajekii]|uniref:Quinolone resistance protein NorB n=1 Tax=Macrococcus hajekii TaxID=198482 RepID=A0A4R6BJU0_9STAP|nr:MFS transporter [Macrococcus hajekii]TDM01958.1 MFS transporter [Macrococcus hajekii]GGB08843.1 MFS transporter [Macrococcus hajekii]
MNETYKGNNKLIIGIVLSVLTFWLFAQSLVNIVPTLKESFNTSMGNVNAALSLTALFCGMFVVGAGGIADKYGRVKVTQIGLILSIIGSALVIATNIPAVLMVGRVIQGLSAAAIMPATLAIVKAYYHGADRQRALSFWSIGSWGGSGICSFFGGAVATFMGWKWIFVFSIILSIIAFFLIKGTPETKADEESRTRFDVPGLMILVVFVLALELFITKGGEFGYTSPISLGLIALIVISFIVFFFRERVSRNPLIDFHLFSNKPYTGAVISNFLLNAVGGTLIVANTFAQQGLGFTSFQAGLLSLTYLVMVLSMIRVGEKLLQKMGAKKPMMLGSLITLVGIALISLTFLPSTIYIISSVIGYLLFGLGLGIYATPSTDTAVATAPDNKAGVAAGIYKMASSLGNGFGMAISGAVFATAVLSLGMASGAMVALWVNVAMALISFLAILFLVPNDDKRVK